MRGAATATPVDILNTSTWSMLVSGRKHLRMVAAAEAAACGRSGDFVDLFETEPRPGDAMWTPSGCVHAVRNPDLSLALAQHYVDLMNVLVAHDGMHRVALAMQRPSAPAGLLTLVIKAGREARTAHGHQAAWAALRPHLIDGVNARRRSATVQAHTLDTAVR